MKPIASRSVLVATLSATLLFGPGAFAEPTAASSGAVDTEGMDTSVAPGDDFFAYANGGWLKRTEIPTAFSSFGSFHVAFLSTEERVASLIQEAGEGEPSGVARKIGDFYASFLDVDAIEERGLAPLQARLDTIAAISDRESLSAYLGSTLRADVDAFNATDIKTDNVLGLWVAADIDEPTRYAPFLLQGGLDMPDRAYYLDESERMQGFRDALVSHVEKVLELAGVEGAADRAPAVVAFETRMAEGHATREDTGDIEKGNNHWSRADFDARAPGMDWAAYLGAARLDGRAGFIVWQPSAVTGLAELVAEEPLEVWKDYLTFHAVEQFAPILPKAVVDENFAFHGKVLAGTQELRERSKLAISATSGALDDEVGHLYVEKYFPPEAKARVEAMVVNIVKAFERRIEALDWMAPETRAQAKAKLDVLEVGVGYPDTWRDHSGLEIVRGDAFGNAERVAAFRYQASLDKLSRAVDRREWFMSPQTVNAVNLPVLNAMNFPAAILQPPFFDPERTLAMDYGGIGAVIGHEVSHSFDDQGAKFDSDGRMRNWWTDEDLSHFQAAGAALAAQYDGYQALPDLAVNGKLTLGENIADVAGIAAAYDAYRVAVGDDAPVVAGMSGDQQFFLSYAQAWRSKFREPALRQRLLGDGHAPGRYRALTVRNLDAWYDAFDVEPGQKLYLSSDDRVRVW